MAKEIILYNLAENVTDEEYKDYVTKENGYEKYYLDAVVPKIVLGGSYLGYFETCKQFYDLWNIEISEKRNCRLRPLWTS